MTDSHSQPSTNELRSISQSTRDGRCLEVWFARNVTNEDRAILSGTIVSHASLKARNQQLEAALHEIKKHAAAPMRNASMRLDYIEAIVAAALPQSSGGDGFINDYD